MVRHSPIAALLVAASLFAASALAQAAQTAPPNPAPCTVAPQPVPCTPTPAAKPAAPADKFPFPGEDATAPKSIPTPDSPSVKSAPSTTPDAPASDKNPDKSHQSGADFPFPTETPAAPASPGESSSSSSSSAPATDALPPDPAADPTADPKPALKDEGSEGHTGRRLLNRVNPKGTKLQSDEEREAEDLDIAHYYTQTGNLKGAYMRSQDAVKISPDDPDAHFALAEAAAKLDKRDEAIAEYTACLKLDPVDKQAAAARKAIARLQP